MHGEKWNMIEMSYESNLNVGYDFVYTKMSWEAVWRSQWMVQMWREVVKWYKNKNVPPICPRHFGISADVETARHWCQSVPKTLRHWQKKSKTFRCQRHSAEQSWVRSVLGPKCPYTMPYFSKAFDKVRHRRLVDSSLYTLSRYRRTSSVTAMLSELSL